MVNGKSRLPSPFTIYHLPFTNYGLFNDSDSRGQRARPDDGRGDGAHLPDLDLPAGGTGTPARRLRVRADAEPDARGARTKPRGARRRAVRLRLRLGDGRD